MKKSILTLFAILFSSAASAAGPTGGAVQGTLLAPGGAPVTNNSVDFKVQILDKTGTCVMYEEQHLNLDLSTTNGDFSFDLGFGSSRVNNMDASNALKQNIFRNDVNVAPGAPWCAGGITFANGDARMLRVQFDLGSGFVAMTPDMRVNGSAYSVIAETLQGKSPGEFVQTRTTGGYNLNQTNIEDIFSATNWPKMQSLLAGTSGDYMDSVPTAAVSFNNQTITNVANPTNAQDAATKNYSDTRVTGYQVDLQNVAPGTGGGKVLVWDQAQNKWVAQAMSTSDNTKLPLDGSVAMSGALQMGAQNITDIGHMTMATQRTIQTGTFTDAQETTLVTSPLAAGDEGKIWYNTDKNTLRSWNGTAASSVLVSDGNSNGAALIAGTNDNQNLQFETNNAVRMTITNSGNVGVGMTAPTHALSLGVGSETVSYNAFTDSSNFERGFGRWSTNEYRLGTEVAGTGTDRGMRIGTFDSNTNNSTVTIGAGEGSSGAGTAYVQLRVNDVTTFSTNQFYVNTYRPTIATAAAIPLATTSGNQFAVTSNSAQGAGVGPSIGFSGSDGTQDRIFAKIAAFKENSTSGNYSGYLVFATRANGGSPTEQMRVTSAGMVGIGSTSPTAGARVDIAGVTAADSSLLIPRADTANRPTAGVDGMIRYNTSLSKFEFHENGGWTGFATGTGAAGDFMKNGSVAMTGNFRAGNQWISNDGDNEGLRILDDGKVGVGVAAPTAGFEMGRASALSAPSAAVTGTWINGGTSTTTKPQLLIEAAGTTSTGWNTGGTGLGVNAPSGWTGLLFDFQINGSSRVKMTGNDLQFNTGASYITAISGTLNLRGSNSNGYDMNFFQQGSSTSTGAGTDTGHLSSTGTFGTASGSATYANYKSYEIINQTGTASGVSRGAWYTPTITSSYDYRAIETAAYTQNILGTSPANLQQVLFNAPTLAAGSAKTVTSAATQVISGAPIAGSNVTITNPYAFWIKGGDARFDGNIGIGATTATAGVDVASTVMGTGTGAYGARFRPTVTASVNNEWMYGVRISPTFNTNGKTGTVQIPLWVSSSAVIDGSLYLSADFGAGRVQVGASGQNMILHGGQDMIFQNWASESMRIKQDGKVGIGTTTPAEALEVKGKVVVRADTTAHRAFGISFTFSANGSSCDTSCGTSYCLGGYLDDTSKTKVACASTVSDRNCICVGQ